MTEIEHSGSDHFERAPLRLVQHIRYRLDKRWQRRIVRPYIEFVLPNGKRFREPYDERELGCVEVEMEPESRGIVWMSRLPITFISPTRKTTPFEPAEQHIMLHLPNYEPIQVMSLENQQPQGQASSCRPPAKFGHGLTMARRSSATGQHPHGQPFPWNSPPALCPQQRQIFPDHPTPGHPPPGHPHSSQFLHPEPLPLRSNPGQPFPDQAIPIQNFSNQPPAGGPPQGYPVSSQPLLGEPLPGHSLSPQNLQQFSAEAFPPEPNNINNQQVLQETVSFETPVPLQTELSNPVGLDDNHMVIEEQTLGDDYQELGGDYQEEMWPAYQVTPNQIEGHTSTLQGQQFAYQQVEEVSVPAQCEYDGHTQGQGTSFPNEFACQQDRGAFLSPQPDPVFYRQDEGPPYPPPDQQITDQQGSDARPSDQLLDSLQQEQDAMQEDQHDFPGSENLLNVDHTECLGLDLDPGGEH